MAKYEPTKEHYELNGGSVEYSLENFLRLYNKYLDILQASKNVKFSAQ